MRWVGCCLGSQAHRPGRGAEMGYIAELWNGEWEFSKSNPTRCGGQDICLRKGFSISALWTFGPGNVLVSGLCCALWRMLSSPSGLYPLDASSQVIFSFNIWKHFKKYFCCLQRVFSSNFHNQKYLQTLSNVPRVGVDSMQHLPSWESLI